MDFQDGEQEAAYRAKARAWLSERAPSFQHRSRGEADALASARRWQAEKAAAGYACITWPIEWGGPGGTSIQQVIFTDEEARFDFPQGVFQVGLGMCLPTVLRVANNKTKQRFVGPALRGETIWCQLFSEPGAGSDLASVRTRATRDGEDWRLNGHKIWTTNAHLADFGLLLARTDPSAPKHAGLSMFWVDMRAAGVEVRPINQISGKSSFNEVFLDNVRISDAQRLGEVGEGWRIALITLGNERLAIGGPRGPAMDAVLNLAENLPMADFASAVQDLAFRERLAEWYVVHQGLTLMRARTVTALARGEVPGAGAAAGKTIATNQLQTISHELTELMDQFGILTEPTLAPMNGTMQEHLLRSPGSRIAGGTDEILKNIIAERVLGLPGEPKPDKTQPFDQLPHGRGA